MRRRSGVHTTALPTEARQLPCGDAAHIGARGRGSAPAGPREPDHSPPQARYANVRQQARTTTYNFTTETKSRQVAPDDPNRAYLAIQNRGANAVFISFSQQANSNSFRLVAGGFFEPLIVPTTSLNILGVAAGDLVVIMEGSYEG